MSGVSPQSAPLTAEQKRTRRNELDRARRAANPEKVRERKRAWRAANREKVLARNRASYAANREKVLGQNQAWREANPEKVRERERARRAANPEKARERNQAWRAANREEVLERKRRQIAEISKPYVARTLKIPVSRLSEDLYQAKREHIVSIRNIKRIKQLIEQTSQIIKEKS